MSDTHTFSNEQLFRKWLRKQYDSQGVRRYSDNSVISYSYALKNLCREIGPDYYENLFFFYNSTDFETAYRHIISSPDYKRVNEHVSGYVLDAALRLYSAFLENGESSVAPEIYAPSYISHNMEEDYDESRGEEFHYEEVSMSPIQKIYYGVPGTGKSYRIMQYLKELYPDPAERDAHCKRLLFHPSYTYHDFIGSIKPLLSADKPMDYVYAAGPFALLLKQAFHAPRETFYLVIEEINRGNAPAIFGDFFQLLDRDESGKSRYSITCSELTDYFSRDVWLKHLFREGKIWLPSNFNILATMNTADDNIFVLDNAFKRRFSLEYVGISFDSMPKELLSSQPVFTGAGNLQQLFAGTPLEEYCTFLSEKGKLRRDWPTFAGLVNRLIDISNKSLPAARESVSSAIAENKKLGPYFISANDLLSRAAFLNKVIFYLKQDVFADSPVYFNSSYEEIYEQYLSGEADIFTLLLPDTSCGILH